MSKTIENGMLRGRPFGGLTVLINNSLRMVTQTIHCNERYVVIEIANYLFVNVYLPCVGTCDRLMICVDDICAWYERFADVDVDIVTDACGRNICQFLLTANLLRCDELFSLQSVPTYVILA